MDLRHAADIVDDAANFLTTDQILPCDEGTAVAESLGTLGMNLRELAKSPLIAAAPELLAALELFVRCIQQYERDDNDLATLAETIESYEAFEIARAAIAKAKGVQS